MNRLLSNCYLYKRSGSVRVWLSDSVESPFPWFNGRAHIVLPLDIIENSKKMKISISHELQHHRQKDTLWVYFLEIIRVIFGIQPLIQRLISQTTELQELACDEFLVSCRNLSPQLYGKTLFEFAQHQHSKLSLPKGAVGMAVKKKFLKRRIQIMFQQQRTTSKMAFYSLLFTGLITMTCTAWAFRGVVGEQKLTLAQAQVLAEKLSKNQEIPIVVDSAVLGWLNKAVGSEKSRKYMRDSLERMKDHEAMIRQKLGGAELPLELLAVPLVESGYQSHVKSTASALGIWQFIAGTARYCGLEVSDEVDERLNPVLLTDAAVCYYTKLHAIFQNWHVALSAYNIGEKAMMSAIADAGHNDVFKLAHEGRLGREGKTYLPKVIAAMIIVKNPELVQ